MTVRIVGRAADGGGARVVVSDEGGGMPAAELAACLAVRPDLTARYERVDDPGGSATRAEPSMAVTLVVRGKRATVDAWRVSSLGGSYNSGSAPISGVGMGLPLSRLYATHLGGALRLEPASGDGSIAGVTATFELPAHPDAPEALPPLPPGRDSTAAWARR